MASASVMGGPAPSGPLMFADVAANGAPTRAARRPSGSSPNDTRTRLPRCSGASPFQSSRSASSPGQKAAAKRSAVGVKCSRARAESKLGGTSSRLLSRGRRLARNMRLARSTRSWRQHTMYQRRVGTTTMPPCRTALVAARKSLESTTCAMLPHGGGLVGRAHRPARERARCPLLEGPSGHTALPSGITPSTIDRDKAGRPRAQDRGTSRRARPPPTHPLGLYGGRRSAHHQPVRSPFAANGSYRQTSQSEAIAPSTSRASLSPVAT